MTNAKNNDHSQSEKERDADDNKILVDMGYKPELKRGLGAIMNFAFGFTEVSFISSVSDRLYLD